jgi:hypothetical protein
MKKFHAAQMRELEEAEDGLDKAAFDSWASRLMNQHTSDYQEVHEDWNQTSMEPYQPPQGILEVDGGTAHEDLHDGFDEDDWIPKYQDSDDSDY